VGWVGGSAVVLTGLTITGVGVFTIIEGYQVYKKQFRNDLPKYSDSFFGAGVDMCY